MKPSKTINLTTGCGGINITLADDGTCLIRKGKSGGCTNALIEAISRLSGELIREGKLDIVIEHLKELQCPSPFLSTLSCPDAIAKALTKLKEEK